MTNLPFYESPFQFFFPLTTTVYVFRCKITRCSSCILCRRIYHHYCILHHLEYSLSPCGHVMFWRFCACMEVIEYLLGTNNNNFSAYSEPGTDKAFEGFLSFGYVFFLFLDNVINVIHFQLQFFHTLSQPSQYCC